MKNVTIISHLTPAEWRLSWNDKVIDDSKGNMHIYRELDCYWGHFTGKDTFTICHHKPDEIKSMSLGMYFNGHIEKDEQGSKITGTFGRKRTTNLFLGLGAILCIMSFIGSIANNDTEIMAVSAILLVILFVVYFSRPQSTQKIIMEQLEKISFDASYHNKKVKKAEKKGKYASMKDITSRDASAIEKKKGKKKSSTQTLTDEVPQEAADPTAADGYISIDPAAVTAALDTAQKTASSAYMGEEITVENDETRDAKQPDEPPADRSEDGASAVRETKDHG